MRRSLLLSAILVLLPVVCPAQIHVHVPDANPSKGTLGNQPFGDGPSWRYLFLLDAKTLGNLPYRVTDLAFATGTSGTFSASQFQVRMSHTTLKATPRCFVDALGPCPIELTGGSLAWTTTPDAWSPLGLSRSFGYDGVRNLAIEFRYRGGSRSVARTPTIRIDSGAMSLTVSPNESGDPYSEKCGNVIRGRPHVRLTLAGDHILSASETVKPGGRIDVRMQQGAPGAVYQIAASLGQAPLRFGQHTVGLSADGLFFASVFVGAPTFTGYAGVVGSGGTASATLDVPNVPALAGIRVYHAGVTLRAGQGVLAVTNTAPTIVVP